MEGDGGLKMEETITTKEVKIYFCVETQGFYRSDMHTIEENFVEITEEQYAELFEAKTRQAHIDKDLKAVEKVVSEDEIKARKISQIQAIFSGLTFQLKSIGIGKSGSKEYIDEQFEIYESMYQNALKGRFDTATNEAIIKANESSKELMAYPLLIVNEIRGRLIDAVEEGNDVSLQIEVLKNLELKKENLTKEKIDAFLAGLKI